MFYLTQIARGARKIPLIGWLCGALFVCIIACWYYSKKASLLAKRLKAEADIRSIQRHHEAYIKSQLEGHGRTSAKTAQAWSKLERDARSKRDELRRESTTTKGLAKAWNDVFSQ